MAIACSTNNRDVIESKFINDNNHYTNYIIFKRSGIFSSNSIRPYLDNDILQKLVDLGYFFTQRKSCILSVDKRHVPTIRLLYQISKYKFQNKFHVEQEKLVVIKDLCQKGSNQFRKIIDCVRNGEPTKRTLQRIIFKLLRKDHSTKFVLCFNVACVIAFFVVWHTFNKYSTYDSP